MVNIKYRLRLIVNPIETLPNPLTPEISLLTLLTVCYTVLVMLLWRIWYWINL